jgi:hypothetical protein
LNRPRQIHHQAVVGDREPVVLAAADPVVEVREVMQPQQPWKRRV